MTYQDFKSKVKTAIAYAKTIARIIWSMKDFDREDY